MEGIKETARSGPRQHVMSVEMPPHLRQRLNEVAARTERSKGFLIRRAVTEWLERVDESALAR